MNLSEKQLKELLEKANLEFERDPEIEETVMKEIIQKGYRNQLIEQNKRKARTGLWVSLILTFLLIISLFYGLFFGAPSDVNTSQKLLPSYVVLALLFMLYQLWHFSQPQLKVKVGV